MKPKSGNAGLAAGENSSAHNGRGLPFQRLLVEVVSIVVGVLLALGLNEWREQRSHRLQAESAIQNIAIELRSNLELLTLLHENNRTALSMLSDDQEQDTDENTGFVPGLQLQETAWETMLSTGVSNYIEYDLVLILSDTYSMQRIYKEMGMQLTQAAMNAAAHAATAGMDLDDRQFGRHFRGYLELSLRIEQALLDSYDRVIEELDSR